MSTLYQSSVRPPVCHTGQKQLKLGLCNFHYTVASCLKLLLDKFQTENSNGFPVNGGVKQWWGGEKLAFSVNNSKMVGNLLLKLLLINYRKLYVCFRLTPRSMTLDDHELL